jgi:hypothetical protein
MLLSLADDVVQRVVVALEEHLKTRRINRSQSRRINRLIHFVATNNESPCIAEQRKMDVFFFLKKKDSNFSLCPSVFPKQIRFCCSGKPGLYKVNINYTSSDQYELGDNYLLYLFVLQRQLQRNKKKSP